MEATCTISKVERIDTADETALALGGRTISGRHGWVVTVEKSNSRGRLIVSRVDGDNRWIVDGDWGPSVFPRFWNGAMSRCTALVAASPEVTAACEGAVSSSLGRAATR